MLNNKLTELLGCKYPLIQTAMSYVSDPKLTAATCNAGGFGFLACATLPADKIEDHILKTKALTDKNFGLNFHMHQPNAADIIKLVIKHRIKAVSYSRSPDAGLIKQLKSAGVLCIPTIGKPEHALKAVAMGADAVTAQGGEGGGYTGTISTSVLIPRVVDALAGKVPVIAAGGFKDGRCLVAALAWGADGIAMGTRFLMTHESPVPDSCMQRYVACNNPAEIIISKAVDGLPQRLIMNRMLADIEKAGAARKLLIALLNGLKFGRHNGASIFGLLRSAVSIAKGGDHSLTQALMSANSPMIIRRALEQGDPNQGLMPSGQVAGVIDQLLSCEEVVNSIVLEAEQRLRMLGSLGIHPE